MDDPIGYFAPWLIAAPTAAILPVSIWIGLRRWFSASAWRLWWASCLVGFAIAPSMAEFGCCGGGDKFLMPAWVWLVIFFNGPVEDWMRVLGPRLVVPVMVTSLLIFGIMMSLYPHLKKRSSPTKGASLS